jgi:calnexin
LKLLRDNKALHQDEFSNVSPYVIMFGPDKCGSTNKVHLIINHKNPKTGEYEEKHLQSPPSARIVKTTELYTLIIHPNNTAIIKLNGEQVKEANLLEDFQPPFNPPKEIDDPKDKKPEDWVDEVRIADPEAKKPEDWDEDAPFEVIDEEATIPEDWLENEPLTVPDPEAAKPEDWDDEEDGDWVAPTVSNPKVSRAALILAGLVLTFFASVMRYLDVAHGQNPRSQILHTKENGPRLSLIIRHIRVNGRKLIPL